MSSPAKYILTALLALFIGFRAGVSTGEENTINEAVQISQKAFYGGMKIFCVYAPATNVRITSGGNFEYTDAQCTTMVNYAKSHKWNETAFSGDAPELPPANWWNP